MIHVYNNRTTEQRNKLIEAQAIIEGVYAQLDIEETEEHTIVGTTLDCLKRAIDYEHMMKG